MSTKTLILIAFLFLALGAFAAGQPAGLEPGVPTLIDLPAQRMLVYTAQGDPDRVAGIAAVIRYPVTRIGETQQPLAGQPAKATPDHPAR